MKKTISLKSFAETGVFGGLKVGVSTKQEVIEKLGGGFTVPKVSEADEIEFINYGSYEFFFWIDSQKLHAIQNDHLQANCINHDEMISFENEIFKIDTWFLKANKNITFKEIVTILEKENVVFKVEPISKVQPEVEVIRFKSGVYLDFTKTFSSYNIEEVTIKKKEDYILNGIRFFEF